MAKYRKRPVVIDAAPVDELVRDASNNWKNLPSWFSEAYESGGVLIRPEGIDINTPEGVVTGNRGDYIIRGIKGELTPCRRVVFEETYDHIDTQSERAMDYDTFKRLNDGQEIRS